ncbi:MAG: cobalamin-dependent protein [Pseudonocardia sp.]|nr:cobalamin-dependent protein [Pseudonocardia sp.]
MTRRGRVVLSKVGLDGHDVGIRLVAKKLTEAGVEVVYLGKRNLPDVIAATAVAEDVDVIGISSLSGGLAEFCVELLDLLREQDADIPVITGGILEETDRARVLAAGARHHFGPGASVSDVVASFTDLMRD